MTFFAAIPIFVLLLLLGVLRRPAWMASLIGLAAAMIVALVGYHMPVDRLVSTVTYGAASIASSTRRQVCRRVSISGCPR